MLEVDVRVRETVRVRVRGRERETVDEGGVLGAVDLSRHKWPWGLVN